MKSIYDIPLYYISFKKQPEYETHLHDIGYQTVRHKPAVDGRKLDPKDLRNHGIISIRSYNDLIRGREEHSGMPSLGAIGCFLSHYEIWKTCIKENYPYMIILEDDADIKPISHTVSNDILKFLKTPNSVYVSSFKFYTDKIRVMMGLHYYIVSLGACKELVKHVFPIDVQVDFYVSHLADIGKINLKAESLFGQKAHQTSIQDTCVKCDLPSDKGYYDSIRAIIIGLGVISIIMFILMGYVLYKYKKRIKN